jgi:hypothetical protein
MGQEGKDAQRALRETVRGAWRTRAALLGPNRRRGFNFPPSPDDIASMEVVMCWMAWVAAPARGR